VNTRFFSPHPVVPDPRESSPSSSLELTENQRRKKRKKEHKGKRETNPCSARWEKKIKCAAEWDVKARSGERRRRRESKKQRGYLDPMI
jgi:hypothetical protein